MSVPASRTSLTERKLHKLGLVSAQDFLLHLPLRYEDETRVAPIARLRPGVWAQVEGEVLRCEVQLRPRRQLVATIADESGELGLRYLNFYPGQQQQLAEGRRVRVKGEARVSLIGVEMVHPRVSGADLPLPDTLTPVYPTTQGLAQPTLRRAIGAALDSADLRDTLPESVRERYGLMGFEQAIRTLHTPPANVAVAALQEQGHPAWIRIKFDELLAQQLSLALARAQRRRKSAPRLPGKRGGLQQRLLETLPFALTGAQRKVVDEIAADLNQAHPMQRLLQGDVGSGKTVVAALAAAQAIDHGYQAALMAPTELLAEQHYRKLAGWLEPLGVKLVWLSGSQGAKARRGSMAALADGSAQLAVGTQALIQDGVQFHRLGLAITDEQHRFGVGQRLALHEKGVESAPAAGPPAAGPPAAGPPAAGSPAAGSTMASSGVHQLMMSATPIPRTLAMTFFADLDVSVIDELPPGRTPVVTKLVDEVRRDEVIARIRAAVQEGRQAYWVCPLVEESEALQLQTAVDTFDTLCAALPEARIGLVHGRLAAADKATVMQAFQAGQLDLLVATTVIEVGVDVPNASLMVIEHAERFGMAQLHQLRGRVGRGATQSACILLYQTPLSRIAKARLRTLYETTDGFLIAQRDLEIRGPGEFLGVRQSGVELLRFADLQADGGLAEWARETASWMLAHDRPAIDAHLSRWLRGRENFLNA